MFRNAGSAGTGHKRLQGKRRREKISYGAAGAARSLGADAEAVAAALASLAEMPIADRSRPPKITDLRNPLSRKRAEQIANSILGEEPITSKTPMIKRPRPAQKGRRRLHH